MQRLGRYGGDMIMASDVVHASLVLWGSARRGVLSGIRRDGLVNTVTPAWVEGRHPERQVAFWSFLTGMLWIALGQQVRRELRRGEAPYPWTGWNLLATSALGTVLTPASPFPMLVLESLLLVAESRRGETVR